MAEPITYVGLDVHKETIAVALAAAGKRGEVRGYGTIANTPGALKALADKLAKLRHPAAVERGRARVCRRRTLADPAQAGRAHQDRPAGRGQSGEAAPGRGADAGVDPGPGP